MSDQERSRKIQEAVTSMTGTTVADLFDRVEKVAGAPENGPSLLCACGYRVQVKDLPVVNTGVCTAVSNVCRKCEKDAEGVAHICCTACKEVFIHVNPYTEKTGFSYEAGKYYHTSECVKCSKSAGATVIEKILYYHKKGVAYSDGLHDKVVK